MALNTNIPTDSSIRQILTEFKSTLSQCDLNLKGKLTITLGETSGIDIKFQPNEKSPFNFSDSQHVPTISRRLQPGHPKDLMLQSPTQTSCQLSVLESRETSGTSLSTNNTYSRCDNLLSQNIRKSPILLSPVLPIDIQSNTNDTANQNIEFSSFEDFSFTSQCSPISSHGINNRYKENNGSTLVNSCGFPENFSSFQVDPMSATFSTLPPIENLIDPSNNHVPSHTPSPAGMISPSTALLMNDTNDITNTSAHIAPSNPSCLFEGQRQYENNQPHQRSETFYSTDPSHPSLNVNSQINRDVTLMPKNNYFDSNHSYESGGICQSNKHVEPLKPSHFINYIKLDDILSGKFTKDRIRLLPRHNLVALLFEMLEKIESDSYEMTVPKEIKNSTCQSKPDVIDSGNFFFIYILLIFRRYACDFIHMTSKN